MIKKTLHRLVGSSNERAFAQLFHAHADALYRFIFWRVGDEERAQDMVSEVFTKAWEKWDKFDKTYPKAWLYTIARNMVIDSYRKQGPELLLEEGKDYVDEEFSLEDHTDAVLEKERLRAAVVKLKDKSRLVIELRFMGGMSSKETAYILETSEENVRIMQYRALKELRRYYEKN